MSHALLFVVTALAAFRVTRLLTTDTLPIVAIPREWLLNHYGQKQRSLPKQDMVVAWSDLFTCPWCMGTWVTAAVFAVVAQCASMPLPALQAVAGMAVVGLVATWSDV